jgi:hypothetical protein
MTGLRTHAACLADVQRNARPFTRTTFKAWRTSRAGVAYPIDATGDCRDNFTQAAAVHCQHHDTLLILECDAIPGERRLHIYTIKRESKPTWQPAEDGTVRAVHRHYAAHVTTFPVSAFEPVEPWRWSPGADVVGHSDPQFIEGISA